MIIYIDTKVNHLMAALIRGNKVPIRHKKITSLEELNENDVLITDNPKFEPNICFDTRVNWIDSTKRDRKLFNIGNSVYQHIRLHQRRGIEIIIIKCMDCGADREIEKHSRHIVKRCKSCQKEYSKKRRRERRTIGNKVTRKIDKS